MHFITLVTKEGGTGKSSLAISLAVAAQERGLRTYVIHLDPQRPFNSNIAESFT